MEGTLLQSKHIETKGERTEIMKDYLENIPSSIKRVVCFASYNNEGVIPDYVVYYLMELRKIADVIIFVADNTVIPKEIEKIESIVVHASFSHHGGYDFGSYRKGFIWAEKHHLLDNAYELVFCNDSCYGPVYPFEEAFTCMDERSLVDFWGLFDSYETVHHIMSFFLVFRKKVFSSPVFCNFVDDFRQQNSFWDYVNLYEKGFTKILEDAGFKSDVYLNVDKDTILDFAYKSGNGNMMLSPATLLNHRMPLVKVKALNNVFGNDLNESPLIVMDVIEKSNKLLYRIILEDLKHRKVEIEDRWLTPSIIIGDARVVSFDIFDTLLARPFKKPTDLFLLMEKELKVAGFCKKRIQAEFEARKKHPGQADVTLEQIYAEFSSDYGYLMQEELRFEQELLFVKEDGMLIYQEAVKKGCRIIAVSDMYLPQSFLAETLEKKGYHEISAVYVSNQEGCCKGDGRLFERVLKLMNISPSDMVHIGDNPISDRETPMKLGIRACLRDSHYDAMMKMPSLAKLQCFSFQDKCSVSFLTALFAQHKAKRKIVNSFEELGYIIGGPLAVGYVQYIYKMAKECGIDGILFVSRDGYALQKVFEKIYPDSIDNYYVQTSRELILKNSVDYSDISYRKRVFEMFSRECLNHSAYSEDLFNKHIEEIRQWAERKKQQYCQYLDKLGITGNHLMTVDMTTRAYTSLNVLRQALGDRVDCGMFSITYKEPCKHKVLSYSERSWKKDDEIIIMLQEELITAPEFTVTGFNDDMTFKYADWNPVERIRIDNYKKILTGILEFADDFLRLSAGHHIQIDYDDNCQLEKYYIKYANYGDYELLKQIYHNDSSSAEFVSLYDILQKKGEHLERSNAPKLNSSNEVEYYYQKYYKHLRIMRFLIWLSAIELAALIGCILYLIY